MSSWLIAWGMPVGEEALRAVESHGDLSWRPMDRDLECGQDDTIIDLDNYPRISSHSARILNSSSYLH
ncbi:MAG: hypothetical protein HQL73_06155 [Magnetococcales bacterium]|nr:hypothetical protein [Magnetococcales bacterium]